MANDVSGAWKHLSSTVCEPYFRTTHRACIRLSVEPPVERIFVLGAASFTHSECSHCCERPIIGDIFDDGEPGPAVCAVDERVAIPTIGLIEELPQTIRAGGDVRRNELVPFVPLAVPDFEAPVSVRRLLCYLKKGYVGDRRRLRFESAQEVVDIIRVALHVDLDAARHVKHEAV